MKKYAIIFYIMILSMSIMMNVMFFIHKAEGESLKQAVAEQDTLSREEVFRYICDMRIYHPKVVLAQAIEESGNFKSGIYQSYNNLFGMRFTYQRVATYHEVNNYVWSEYYDWKQSVTDYALWQLQQKGVAEMTDKEYIDFLDRRYCKNQSYKKKIQRIYDSIKFE